MGIKVTMTNFVKLFEDFSRDGKFELPSNHVPAIRVPKGGSCCANCKYWTGTECSNQYYNQWNGSGEIPTSPNEYCSDWYEPKNPT
jgi:hypothetical protein